MNIKLPIYLDNIATTQTDPRVVEAMLPYFSEKFGNYSSKHKFGYEAKSAVELAREQIAKLITANPDEIIFTSGATESINLAHIGFAIANQNKGKHIISSMVEHSASFESLNFLSKAGFEITFIKPDKFGFLEPDEVIKNVRKDTILISLIYANNEIGTIIDIKTIADFCNAEKIVFHTDATQAVGKIKVDVRDLNPSLMSFTAHKIYGPKGIGALFINRNSFKFNLSPMMFGGNQESSLRSGTLNVPAIVGFGVACDILLNELDNDMNHYKKLSDYLKNNLIANLSDIKLNGHTSKRIANNLSFTVKNVFANDLIRKTPEIAFSTGSACSSEGNKKNRILKAIGLNDSDIDSTFRLGIGRFNTMNEIEFAAERLIYNISYIREKNMNNKTVELI
jgi:cysteine desulfurase